MTVVNFNGFSVAVYCILMIYQKTLSKPCRHFDIYFKLSMSDFATAALLRRIEGALKSVSLLSISHEMAY